MVSSETFQKLDHIIWEMLWRWAKRRHPNKSKTWIINKYWKRNATRKWNFQTERNSPLFLSKTRIYRHIPLKLQMHPFLNTDYFRERQSKIRFRNSHSVWKKKAAAWYRKGYRTLELDALKGARPVLRRGRASNRSFLFNNLCIVLV